MRPESIAAPARTRHQELPGRNVFDKRWLSAFSREKMATLNMTDESFDETVARGIVLRDLWAARCCPGRASATASTEAA